LVWADGPERFRSAWSTGQQLFDIGVSQRQHDLQARETFRQAAAEYQKAIEMRGGMPAMSRMGANSWLLAGDLPRAIAVYRQGLDRYPDDEHLRRGLEYARSQVAYTSAEDRAALTPRPEELGFLKRVLRRWGLATVALASALAWI